MGTNLSLDVPLVPPVPVAGTDCNTVRQWDAVQSSIGVGKLPSFESSRLANTIGVAVGITATMSDGRSVFLCRKRIGKVAIYAGMWHVPFSFALSLTPNQNNGYKDELKSFIQFDLGHEQGAELDLQPAELGPLTPIAFCRDLVRGGKPQFFFESQAKISFEELQERVSNAKGEYAGRPKVANYTQDAGYSPELICLMLLKSVNEQF